MSDDSGLKRDLDLLQRDIFHSIPLALARSPFLGHEPDTWSLASSVFGLVRDKWVKICRHPEVSKHLNKVLSVQRMGVVGIGDEKTMGIMLVRDMLERQAKGLQTLIFKYDNDFGQKLLDFFLGDEVTIVTRAPLYGVDVASADPVALEQGIQLNPEILPSDEFAISMPFSQSFSKIRPSSVFEHTWHEKKIVTEPEKVRVTDASPEEDPSFLRLVFTLRLLGMRNFNAPYVETRILAPGIPLGYRQFYFAPPVLEGPITDADIIEQEMISGLLNAWKNLEQVLAPKYLRSKQWLSIALNRMNDACERHNSLDRLLDLCVCLEALLTRGSQQVTYQFRQRGAFLLSLACAYLGEGQLRSIREFLGDAYEMRSRLVHGDPPDTSEVEETNARLFELARIFSLKSIVLSSRLTKDDIIDRIDLGMADQKARAGLEEIWQASDLASFWNAPYEKVSTLFQDTPVGLVSSTSCELT